MKTNQALRKVLRTFELRGWVTDTIEECPGGAVCLVGAVERTPGLSRRMKRKVVRALYAQAVESFGVEGGRTRFFSQAVALMLWNDHEATEEKVHDLLLLAVGITPVRMTIPDTVPASW